MPARYAMPVRVSRVGCAVVVAGLIATACGKIGYDADLDGGLARDVALDRKDEIANTRDVAAIDMGVVEGAVDDVFEAASSDSNPSSDAPPDVGDTGDVVVRDARFLCPSGIDLANPTSTPMHGGTGGNPGTEFCPAGQAIIGFAGTTGTDGLIDMIETLCGRLTLVPAFASCDIVPTIGATLAMHGDPLAPGSRWTMKCPAGRVVAGIRGRTGDALDQLAIDCVAMNVTNGSGTYIVSISAATAEPAEGGAGGTPFADFCPRGDVAKGIDYRSGALIDAFAIFCADVMPVP